MAVQKDGHPTLISFTTGESGVILSTLLEELGVTPPGVDGGGPNDITNMRNLIWRTAQPKQLKTLTPSSFSAHWDPAVFDEITSMINVNQAITITFPDGSTIVFWGWLNSFLPNEQVEGEAPTADCVIEISNLDAADAEISPVFTAA